MAEPYSKQGSFFLRCPTCGGRVALDRTVTATDVGCATCGSPLQLANGVADFSGGKEVLGSAEEFSRERWTAIYHERQITAWSTHLAEYKKLVFENVLAQSPTFRRKLAESPRPLMVLEIGAGRSEWAYWMAARGHRAVAIDVCREVLHTASAMFSKQGGTPGLFVVGNIEQMPFPDETFDLIYGGGVIEHLADTGCVLRECARILKPDGIMINTVPALSLRTMFRRDSIPYLGGIRQAVRWVQMGLLRGRWMRYGFQYSFTRTGLKRLHRRNGLHVLYAGRYDVGRATRGAPAGWARRLADRELFWDVLLVEARREMGRRMEDVGRSGAKGVCA